MTSFISEKAEGDIPGDDLGDLINIRLIPGDSDHQLEEIALHVVHPMDAGLFPFCHNRALIVLALQFPCQIQRLLGIQVIGSHFLVKAVRHTDNIAQRGLRLAEIHLEDIHRVHDAEEPGHELKVLEGNAIPLLLEPVDHLLCHRMDNAVISDLDHQRFFREHPGDILHQKIGGKGDKGNFVIQKVFIIGLAQQFFHRAGNPGLLPVGSRIDAVLLVEKLIGDYRLLVIEYGLSDDISFHIPLSSFCR